MGKYKIYRLNTDRRDKQVNLKLAKKQTQEDRLDNVLEEFLEIKDMEKDQFWVYEDLAEQKKFLKKLLLEAEIIGITGEPKIRKPILQKSKIARKINNLKTEIEYYEDAIKQYNKQLEKHKKNNDKRNYKLVKLAIEEIEKHQKIATEKFRLLNLLLKNVNGKD